MEMPKEIHLKNYTQPHFWCDTVKLDIDISEKSTRVITKAHYARNETLGLNSLILDGIGLNLESVKVNGEVYPAENYIKTAEHLKLDRLPNEFELEIQVVIDHLNNFSGEGLYKSGNILCTQCEAEGFRRIAYFQDRPDVMSKFQTTITANKKQFPRLLSNGNLVSSTDLEEGRHTATWEDPFKKPAYLFAMVAGDLAIVEDTFKTKDNRDIKLEIFVDPGNEGKCSHAMESLKNSMKWDEDRFGLIYDLDIYMIVAVDSFNMGAMENKGLNIFNSHYVLASQSTATDSDFQGVESVIGHEYFHNWTGNRVTCRDWFQLTLKEGLTVFRDQEFSCDMGSRAVKRIEDVAMLKAHQFPEDQSTLSHPIQPKSYIEINNFYTATVYEKGSEVIRMVHTLLGEQKFRAGIDLYFKRHDGQAVTCEDFISAMSDASGVDLKHFSVWYDQNGTPKLKIETTRDKDKDTFQIEITQTCKTNNAEFDSLYIPLRFDLYSSEGELIDLQGRGEVNLSEKKTSIVLENITSEVIPAFNTNFSAPVIIDYNYTDEQLYVLMGHAKDHYTRYNSAQIIYEKEVIRSIELLKSGSEVTLGDKLETALLNIVGDKEIDLSFKAYLLSLPTQRELFNKWDKFDFDLTKRALKDLKQLIAKSLEVEFREFFKEFTQSSEAYVVNTIGIAQRAYFNQCISYLGCLNDEDFYSDIYNLLRSADNMTIEFGALRALMSNDNSFESKASDYFYNKWKHETLVIQKWLSLSSASSSASVSRLKILEQIPEYDKKVPNLVRSLIGAFSNNISILNDESGEGYAFIASKILEIDSYNPQLASRIAKNLNYLSKLDRGRASKLKDELVKILDSGKLSKDCLEVVRAIVS